MNIRWTPIPTDEVLGAQASHPPTTLPITEEIEALQRGKNNVSSDVLRCEVNKAIGERKPLREVCLLLLRCVSVMTGDTAFYAQNEQLIQGKEE